MKTPLSIAVLALGIAYLMSFAAPAHADPVTIPNTPQMTASKRQIYWTWYPNTGGGAAFTPRFVEVQAIVSVENSFSVQKTVTLDGTIFSANNPSEPQTDGQLHEYTGPYDCPANTVGWKIMDCELGGAPANGYRFRFDFALYGAEVIDDNVTPDIPLREYHLYTGNEDGEKEEQDLGAP